VLRWAGLLKFTGKRRPKLLDLSELLYFAGLKKLGSIFGRAAGSTKVEQASVNRMGSLASVGRAAAPLGSSTVEAEREDTGVLAEMNVQHGVNNRQRKLQID